MAISGKNGVHVILTFFTIYSISCIAGVSVSSVSITKKEGLTALSKSLSKINLPQVPVPEFPKFVYRPPKNPSSQSSSSPSGGNGGPNQQQQNPSSSQSHQSQQPTTHQSFTQNNQVHNIVPSIQISPPNSILYDQDDEDMSGDLSDEIIIAEAEHEFHDGFTPSENFTPMASPSSVHSLHQEKVQDLPSIPQPLMNFPALPKPSLMDSPSHHPMPPVINLSGKPGLGSSSSSNAAAKNDTGKNGNQMNGEKLQDASDFPMPLHVMTILNALGSGGSLAQASKPEKDGAGQGFTTANAVGYATGDNATVTASVSNKMEVNTQTIILTESATASASSLSNGTAFSQANLSSNGWGQLGQGNWPTGPGSGWAKASSPSKKGKKLGLRRPLEPLFYM